MLPISTNDETAPLKGKSKAELFHYTIQRWFVEGKRGRDLVFFDTATNKGNQSRGLVRQSLINLGVEASDLDGNEGVLTVAQFRWIQPTAIYRQWAPPIFQDRTTGYISRNLWRRSFKPSESSPSDTSVAPLLDMLDKAYGHEPEAIVFLLDTLAHRLHAQVLPRQELIVLLYSYEGATGKGSVLDMIDEVFGVHAVKRTDFRSAFTDQNSAENWGGNFVLLDETSISRDQMSALKSKVSTQTISANAKNTGSVDYDINAVPVLATNEIPSMDDAMARRVLLLASQLADIMPERSDRVEYLTGFKQWLRNGGAEAIFQWLWHRPISEYKPYMDAPLTAAKAEVMDIMSVTTASTLADFVESTELTLFLCEHLYRQGLPKNVETARHILNEAGLSQRLSHRLVSPDGKRISRVFVVARPWELTHDKQNGNKLTLRHKETGEMLPLEDAPGFAELFEENPFGPIQDLIL